MRVILLKALVLYAAVAAISLLVSVVGSNLGMGSVQFLYVFFIGLLSLTMNCFILYHLDSKGLLTNKKEDPNG